VDSVEDIDARLDDLTSANHEAITASTQKRQPAKQPLPSIPPTIIANIREKNRLRKDWQINRDPTTKNRINCLQRWIGFEIKEWRNAQWSDTFQSLNPEDQSLWKITKWVMRIPDPNPPLQVPSGLACLDSEKAKILADNLESQFQTVPVPPLHMDNVEQVREEMQSYAFAPAS